MSNYLALLNYNLTRVNASTINYSTLVGSTIIASSIVSNSSINVTNIITQTINYSTLTGSTLTAQTINYSTLTGSSMATNTMTTNALVVNSTLTGSTLTTQNVNYSTLTGSTLTAQTINYSTLRGSTMTINTLVIASTLTVSTLIATNNPAGVITSSMISLGASTNQSYTALAQGNYSTSTNWLSTLNNLSSTKFVAMSGNAQTQLAVTQFASVSSVYYTSTLGTSWSTISNVTGLPIATQTNYTCGAVSGNGLYGLLGANGNLYVTSTLTSAVGPSFTTVVPNRTNLIAYYQFENNINGLIGPNLTATGSLSYVNGIVGSKAVYLANTAGTANSTNYLRATLSGITNALSVTGWFNLQTSISAPQIIFASGDGNFVLYANAGGIGFNVNNTLVGNRTGISLNTWYNFTCIAQSNGMCYLYVNNALIGSYSLSGSFASASTIGFGTYDVRLDNGFNGYIDDIRIYNSAITFTPVVSPNWSNVAISNSGQYMLATVENGGLYMSSNFGSTWSQVSAALLQAAWSLLEISSTGQYMSVYAPLVTGVIPQFSGITGSGTNLSTSSWQTSGVTWIASASSIYSNSFPVSSGFNNSVSNSWASINAYTPSYTGSANISTFILGVGTINGEWLQLQSSTPLVMNSYTFASGGSQFQLPRNYYIVGSNDGTNWYPIQNVTGTTNAATAIDQAFVTYFNVSYTGTQSIVGGQTGSYATIAYPTSGNAYTYFRIIPTSLWTSGTAAQIAEWYINFTAGGQLYSTNYGAMWCNLMPANTSKLALSGSGQYTLENINTTTVTTTPQLTGLTGSANPQTWNVSGVVWTASSSSIYSNYYGTNAFNNSSTGAWASNATSSYNPVYQGTTYGTIILGGIGTIYGEWLQLQSSVPLVMSSYTFISGAFTQLPKNYYIVGSNDNSSWYPIQYVVGIVNPATVSPQAFTTYFNISYTGLQIITAGQVGSFYTTAYPTSGNAYTYFRMIVTSVWTGAALVEIGEWFINFNNIFTQPQLTGLTGATTGNAVTSWTSNNVTWTSSASSVYINSLQPWTAFNNVIAVTGNYSWASASNYSGSGVYNNTYSTTISAPYSAAYTGEWLQIQSSVPFVIYNYSFACGDPNNFLKTYFIVGSNDGTTWFPIQLVNMGASNPFGATSFRTATSYLLANYTGSQILTSAAVPAGVTVTTTSYSTSSNAYTYFRIISNSVFANIVVEIGEWFINFSNTLTSPQLTGLAGDTTSSTPVATSWILNNIRWTSTASSVNGAAFQPWNTFNNVASTSASGNYSWASALNYSAGAYNNTNSTTISTLTSPLVSPNPYPGEWIQIQSSVPVVMYNYTFACGFAVNIPKTYLIAGSNDGTIWYPIQLASIGTNPFTDFKTGTYLLANYTGSQSLTATTTQTVTTTAYSTSSNAYTYFRIIANTNFASDAFQLSEWFVNFTTTTVSPQLSGLTGNTSSSTPVPTTWAANNITWTCDASSVNSTTQQVWIAFNNAVPTSSTTPYSWASLNRYAATGVYTGSVSTTISAPYSAAYLGEWLQIQSSVPVVLYNYSFACASFDNIPRVYLIAGSNDGTTWYPIQLASMASNPFGTTSFRPATSYLLANSSSIQTLTSVASSASVTTTSYSTSGNAYTYFRIISNVSFGGGYFELEEWFVNFTPTQYVTSNYLSATSSTPYTAPVFSPALTSTNVPITSAASQTGQYMVLITNNTSGANVYYSTNYGANFTGLTIGTSTMVSCAISLDGSCITVMNATTVYQLNNNSIGFSVAVGNQAGQQNQYQNAIAIGNYAGQQNQTANSIVLNATGTALNSYVPGFYVSPVQQYGASTGPVNVLGYGSDNQIVQASIISLSPSGFVGIGTTNPTSLLHVNGGNVSISGGNVGIGISTPYQLLHVNNGIRVTSGGNTYGAGGFIEFGVAVYPNYSAMSNITGYLQNAYLPTAQLQGGLQFNVTPVNGSAATTMVNAMTILGSGNVGIGTNNPNAPLHVIGNINLTGSVQYNGVSITTGTGSIWNAAAGGVAYYTGGNVGIGTASPYSQLSLHAAYTASGLFPTSSITWSTTNGTPWQLGSITGYVAAGASGSTGSLPGGLAFATKAADNSYSSSLTTRMVLDAAGFVGIGITTPLTHLYVYSNTGSGWDGRGYFGNATTGFVCGTYNNGVLIGGHNAALGAWTNITIGAAATNTSIPGSLSKGSGTFDIEHPLYPNTNKRLVHSFIEGPRCDLIYRGTVALTNGSATVYIDKQCTYIQEDAMDNGTFEALCANPQYFLQNMSGFNRVVGSIYQGILTITCENNTSTDMISWMVVAERKDPFVKQWNRTDSNGYLNTQYTNDNL